ncbi:hypothetical protein [Kitasatospora sp. CB01950]|uniref:hypothetical protein n=1 Tax=Kitasatospora sp. CB01950 TaxID=1703930 RepID=UPI000939F8C8|nr:hypothetical protein [Kitasatospora sp. CB01950]OKI95079.1 hypothetical protein AMK19_32935 [Kitasatospora sp. CB01950]
MPDITLAGRPLWLLYLVFGVAYAATLGAAIAFAEWRGAPWSAEELRRRQAPVLVAGLGVAFVYVAAEIAAAAVRLGG